MDGVALGSGIQINWRRLFFIILGPTLFFLVYSSPPWADAVDPLGKHFPLTREGKGALAVFLWAGTWWVFEVVPIGVTSLLIGVLQALFMVRPAKNAFRDFMDPSVLFIFGSVVIGLVFTKTGLARRIAYRMLLVVGEKTNNILLGCFILTAALTHIMAHTAVAATMFPLLLSIHSLYAEDNGRTKFGKALFMGMAYVAGAGSIITLLGAARGVVAIGFFNEIAKKDVGFFELTYYMAPIGWLMVFLLWGFFVVLCPAERKVIPGLKEKARTLALQQGPMSKNEILALLIIAAVLLLMSVQSFIPALKDLNKTAIILCSTIMFFLTGVLDIKDLEDISWNVILLFAGAMSIGFCLWETGAAKWLAVNWLTMFQKANWFVFVLSMAFFVLVMTNFIMNVAAIAISLPVALVIAPYLGVAGEVIFYAGVVTAGMPFILLVGAAPNAIAYESKQFTAGEFFGYGIPASILLMVVLGLFVAIIWPIMGMPVTMKG